MFREHLEKYLVCVQTLCGIQLVLSVLSMATGAALLVLASSSDSLEWPLNSGVGVWTGSIVSINILEKLYSLLMTFLLVLVSKWTHVHQVRIQGEPWGASPSWPQVVMAPKFFDPVYFVDFLASLCLTYHLFNILLFFIIQIQKFSSLVWLSISFIN